MNTERMQELVNASGQLRDALELNPRRAKDVYDAAERFARVYENAERGQARG